MGTQVQSRRRPWPYDVYIDGMGMMLIEDEQGAMIGRKAKPLEATPTDFAYGSMNPFRERVEAFRHLVMGLGEEVQPKGEIRRYKKMTDGDPSVDGYWQKGPKFHRELVAGGHAIKRLFWAQRPEGRFLHAITARYIMYRVGDNNWQVSLDSWGLLGPGATLNWAVSFKWAGAGAVEAIYATANIGGVLEYNASTGAWSQLVPGIEGPPDLNGAEWVTTVGDELWFGKGNLIQKVEANPRVSSNYAGFIRIGEATTKITFMTQNKNALHVFKEDGIYTVSTAALDQEPFPFLRRVRGLTNGQGSGTWLDSLWVPYGDAFFKIDPDGTLQPVGFEQLLANHTDVRGQIVGFTGHATYFGYELVYDSLGTDTHLVKYGAWVETDDNRFNEQVVFQNTHHGALKTWENVRGTFIDVLPFEADNDRLYCGFDDGYVEWCYLPKGTPNPFNDSRCEYTEEPTYMELPDHHGGFQADPKIWFGISVFAPHLNAEQYVTVDYRTDPTGDWNPMQDANGEPVRFTLNGQRIDFQQTDVPTGRALQLRFGLWSEDSNGVATDGSPLIEGVGIHYAVRPSFQLQWSFRIKAGNTVGKHDGTTMVRKSDYIRTRIQSVVSKVGITEVLMPDSTTEQMIFVDYNDILAPFKTRNGIEWGVTAEAMQYRTITQEGGEPIVPGLTHGTLEQYIHGELEELNLL